MYHQVIEGLRRECVDHGGSRASIEIRGEICAIVEEGLTFYESLLEGMQELHGFRLDQSSHTSLGDSYAGDSNGSRGSKHGPPNSTPVKVNATIYLMAFFPLNSQLCNATCNMLLIWRDLACSNA